MENSVELEMRDRTFNEIERQHCRIFIAHCNEPMHLDVNITFQQFQVKSLGKSTLVSTLK